MVGGSTITIPHTNGNIHVGSGAVGNESPQKIKDEDFSDDILKTIFPEKYSNLDWNSSWSSSMRDLRSQIGSNWKSSNLSDFDMLEKVEEKSLGIYKAMASNTPRDYSLEAVTIDMPKSMQEQVDLREQFTFNPDLGYDQWHTRNVIRSMVDSEPNVDNLSELKESLADDPDFSKPEEQIDMDLIYDVFGVDEVEQSIVDNKDQWRMI